jgi:tetratricopeptide (TPR) repeat protein
LPSPLFVRLRFGLWGEVVRVPEPDLALQVTHAIWHFARGVAFARSGKLAEAGRERAALSAAAANMPGETPFGLNSATSVLQIAEHVLDARIASAAGDRAKAVESWRKAVAAQDGLNYDEPPGWYYPVRESLGGALLLSGEAGEAEKVFREDLKMNPRNGRSLFGLKESLKAQGKRASARGVEAELKEAWKRAEVRLKVVDL